MGGSNSKNNNKKNMKSNLPQNLKQTSQEQSKAVVLNTTMNDTKNVKLSLNSDSQKRLNTLNDLKKPELSTIENHRGSKSHALNDQTNEYEQIIKESLREMEENQIDEHLLQEMLQDSPNKDYSTINFPNPSKAAKIVTQDGLQRPTKLPPLNPKYKPQIKYPNLSYPQEPSVKIADQTEDLENSFEYNAYEFRNTYKSRPDRSEDNSEFDYTIENRFKLSSGLNNAQLHNLELSRDPSMTQTQRNDQFPSMIFIRDDQTNMNSLQKSKPFQIKKQNIPFDPIVDENDESFDRYGGTKDRHLDQPRGGRKPKQQSYDDSDFKNSLKSDEFYNTKKPNIFVTRRRSTDFAYKDRRQEAEMSQDDKPSSLENEPNDNEDYKQNNNYHDQLDDLIDNNSDDEYDYYQKENSKKNIPTTKQGIKIETKQSSFRKIL